MVERNRAETGPGVCHSHDFCDANMVVYAVFLRHGMAPASEEGMERQGALRDQAWNLANRRGTFESRAEAALTAYLRGDDRKA